MGIMIPSPKTSKNTVKRITDLGEILNLFFITKPIYHIFNYISICLPHKGLNIKTCNSLPFMLICVNNVNNKEKAKYYKEKSDSR